MKNEEQELADIACGKRSKEDQALWDKVAKELFTTWTNTKSKGAFASVAFECADAFMAERAKRMKGGV